MSIEHTGLDERTEPWWLGPQRRMVLVDPPAAGAVADAVADAAADVDPASSVREGLPGREDPAEVVTCYARQVDELAALVEVALTEEDTDYAAQVTALRVRHQRRVTSLRVLAESLGETHGELDELAHQLRDTTSNGVPCGYPAGPAVPAAAVAKVSPLVRGGR